MRPIDRGNSTQVYLSHGDARHDLAGVLGYYCSYCEMNVWNMIEVEHIIPVNQGGNSLSWNNFLLSCRYCNGIKSDNNISRIGYLWVDVDNTDLAFQYSIQNVIEPIPTLPLHIKTLAENTIQLTGLDRIPSGANEPTEADTRWRSRKESWDEAIGSLNRWRQAPILEMAKQIAVTSVTSGHYSIWKEVFKLDSVVLDCIDFEYYQKGLFKQFLFNNTREIRNSGNI